MCLILFAYKAHPQYRLILAANRDEFYQRPTRRLDYWPEAPTLLAGQDLEAGGTWLGITHSGRFSAITNVREGFPAGDKPLLSRGRLPLDYLLGDHSPQDYLATIQEERYAGFNLLCGDLEQLYFSSNRHQQPPQPLPPGVYGLSNASLNSPWPKSDGGRRELQRLIAQDNITSESLFQLLQNRQQPDDEQLPDTGVGIEWERRLGPRFIESELYGTRSSLVLLCDYQDGVTLYEQSYTPQWQPARGFQFEISA